MKPSEKAMQVVREIITTGRYVGAYHDRFEVDLKAGAELIEQHTAEALSEHKRVLELVEKALTGSISYVNCFGSKNFSGHKEAIAKAKEIANALAEIAKLRKE